jgi:hypothetical protein
VGGFKQLRSQAVEPLIIFRVFLCFTRHFLLDFPNLQQRLRFAQFDLFHKSITSCGVWMRIGGKGKRPVCPIDRIDAAHVYQMLHVTSYHSSPTIAMMVSTSVGLSAFHARIQLRIPITADTLSLW